LTLTPAQAAWIDRARDADIVAVAARPPLNAVLKRFGREWIGPCPACGGADRFAVNPSKKGGVFNCRGFGGGDAIAMVMHVAGVQFLPACAIINGEDFPAGAQPPAADPAARRQQQEDMEAAARARELTRAERDLARAKEADAYRQRERATLYDIWTHAADLDGSSAARYLARRGLERPPGCRLRCVEAMPYFHGDELGEDGRKRKRVIHRGPALLAPIIDHDGRFAGLHFTYLDLAAPNGKAALRDPKDDAALPAKKARGSKQGHHIEVFRGALVERDGAARLVLGEGIEKTIAVYLALAAAGRELSRTLFWVASDLGNLAGAAAASVPHPHQKTANGRALRVAGPLPDLTRPGLAIPASVGDVVLLGDSTSDPFTTQCALARAGARYG
jgi:hypothetical protein